MPYQEVMHKFKHGQLHSGSKSGPQVKNRKQAIAIMLSEKKSGEGEPATPAKDDMVHQSIMEHLKK